MRIENLRIDRFGDQTQITTCGFSNRLNLILTSDDKTRRNVVQFLRWMLFGNCDSAAGQYLTTPRSAAGSLTVFRDGMRRTIARQDDGTRYGRLAVDGGGHYAPQTNHMVSLLGNVTQNDFDLLFAPPTNQAFDFTRLVDTARRHGLQLESRTITSPRRAELQQRIDVLRRELEQQGWTNESLETLMQRRRSLELRIEQVREEHLRRRRELENRMLELNQQIQSEQRDVERLRADFQVQDAEVSARRQQLEEAWRIAQEAKERFLRERRDELNDIESRVQHWRNQVADIRQRLQQLDGEVLRRDGENSHQESSCLVSELARRIDHLRGDLGGLNDPRYSSSTTSYSSRTTPPNLGPALDELRNDVTQLCGILQQRGADKRYHLMREELDQLRHCDQTLSAWIQKMEAQRDLVLNELQQAETHGIDVVDTMQRPYLAGSNFVRNEHRTDYYTQPGANHSMPTGYLPSGVPVQNYHYQPLVSGSVDAQLHSCNSYEPIHPDSDSLLRDLIARRDSTQAQLTQAQHRLDALMTQRRDLEALISGVREGDVDAIHREIAEIDRLLIAARRRDELQREITRLQDELTRVRDEHQPSHVVEYASQLLRIMTRGRDHRLRIDGVSGLWVEDANGNRHEMLRSSRNHATACLCLRLAIVAALRERGIEAPVIVEEPFSSLDAADDEAFAAAISNFAERGNQVLVFSRHRHTPTLFGQRPFQLIELAPTYTPQPIHPVSTPRTEVVEAVRFRPQSEIERETGRYTHRPVRSEAPSGPSTRYDESTRYDRTTRYSEPTSFTSNYSAPAVHTTTQTTEPVIHRRVTSRYVEPTEIPTEYQRREIYDREPVVPATVRNKSRRVSRDAVSSEISLHTRIDETRVIDRDIATALSDFGVMDVREFLELDPDTIERELTEWDLPNRPIRRWQNELSLRCWAPGMTAEDAELLRECGIKSIAELAEAETDDLIDRIRDYLSSGRGSRFGRPDYDEYLRSRVGTWIRGARGSRSQWRSFSRRGSSRQSSRARSRSSDRSRTSSRGSRRSSTDSLAERRTQRALDRAERESTSRRSRTRTTRDRSTSSRTSERRSSSRREQTSEPTVRMSRSTRDSTSRKSQTTKRELKFYLDASDPIVDAPSIGARTAEKFQRIGVKTVTEFLRLNPETAAAKLDDRRINAETLREWQAQANLACRIPQIRGHDAQILVACELTTPEEVAKMTPEDLWAIVKPFTKTAEGKRIIRGGKSPDLAEIRDWITWAQSSRSLRAA